MESIGKLREVMNEIEKDFLNKIKLDTLSEEFTYFKEAMALYAKQHNLIKSTLLLIDNNMNEEAIVLARSALNNYFLISYLLNDPDGSHYKEFAIQPTISAYFYWMNVKKMMKKPLWVRLKEAGCRLEFKKSEVNKNIAKYGEQLRNAGYEDLKKIKTLSISKMAESADEHGLGLYATYYAEASKFEHSDINSLDVYKRKNTEGKDYRLATNWTNNTIRNKAIQMIILSYLESYRILANEILIKKTCLKKDFDENVLVEIFKKNVNEILEKLKQKVLADN